MPRNNLTPSERALLAAFAGNTSWAKTPDRTARTEPGRQAMLRKFEQQVDPEGILSPAERAKRAKNARTAHMQRLAFKSATNRRRRKEARDETGAA